MRGLIIFLSFLNLAFSNGASAEERNLDPQLVNAIAKAGELSGLGFIGVNTYSLIKTLSNAYDTHKEVRLNRQELKALSVEEKALESKKPFVHSKDPSQPIDKSLQKQFGLFGEVLDNPQITIVTDKHVAKKLAEFERAFQSNDPSVRAEAQRRYKALFSQAQRIGLITSKTIAGFYQNAFAALPPNASLEEKQAAILRQSELEKAKIKDGYVVGIERNINYRNSVLAANRMAVYEHLRRELNINKTDLKARQSQLLDKLETEAVVKGGRSIRFIASGGVLFLFASAIDSATSIRLNEDSSLALVVPTSYEEEGLK